MSMEIHIQTIRDLVEELISINNHAVERDRESRAMLGEALEPIKEIRENNKSIINISRDLKRELPRSEIVPKEDRACKPWNMIS